MKRNLLLAFLFVGFWIFSGKHASACNCEDIRKFPRMKVNDLYKKGESVVVKMKKNLTGYMKSGFPTVVFVENDEMDARSCSMNEIFIFSGVLKECGKSEIYFEDCLGFVIGHELGHVYQGFFWEKDDYFSIKGEKYPLIYEDKGVPLNDEDKAKIQLNRKIKTAHEEIADKRAVFFMILASSMDPEKAKKSGIIDKVSANPEERKDFTVQAIRDLKSRIHLYRAGIFFALLGNREKAEELFLWAESTQENTKTYEFPENKVWQGILKLQQALENGNEILQSLKEKKKLKNSIQSLPECIIIFPWGSKMDVRLGLSEKITLKGLRGGVGSQETAKELLADARDFFQSAIKIGGESPAVYNNLACTHFYLGEFGTAIDLMNSGKEFLITESPVISGTFRNNDNLFNTPDRTMPAVSVNQDACLDKGFISSDAVPETEIIGLYKMHAGECPDGENSVEFAMPKKSGKDISMIGATGCRKSDRLFLFHVFFQNEGGNYILAEYDPGQSQKYTNASRDACEKNSGKYLEYICTMGSGEKIFRSGNDAVYIMEKEGIFRMVKFYW